MISQKLLRVENTMVVKAERVKLLHLIDGNLKIGKNYKDNLRSEWQKRGKFEHKLLEYAN